PSSEFAEHMTLAFAFGRLLIAMAWPPTDARSLLVRPSSPTTPPVYERLNVDPSLRLPVYVDVLPHPVPMRHPSLRVRVIELLSTRMFSTESALFSVALAASSVNTQE